MANEIPGKLDERFLFCSSVFLPKIIKGELNDFMCQNGNILFLSEIS